MSDALVRLLDSEFWKSPPQEPVAFARLCRQAWADVRDALVSVGAESAPAKNDTITRSLFHALCVWRVHRALKLPASDSARLESAFVIQCGLRMLVLDRIQKHGKPESLHLIDSDVAHEEDEDICLFTPVTRAEALRLTIEGGDEFFDKRQAASTVARVAFCVLFTDTGENGLPTELIRAAERLDRWDAARTCFQCMVRKHARAAQESPHADADLAARVTAWARARSEGNFSDDAIAAFTERIIADRLNPAFAFTDTERASAVLARSRPRRATVEVDAAAPGVRFLHAGACAKETVDTLTCALFDYAMQQTHGVEWARTFTQMHHRPLGATAKLKRYLEDRMMSPPPMVLRCTDGWYVAERTPRPGALESVWKHENAASALAHWCALVMDKRQGTVSLGKDCSRIIQEIRQLRQVRLHRGLERVRVVHLRLVPDVHRLPVVVHHLELVQRALVPARTCARARGPSRVRFGGIPISRGILAEPLARPDERRRVGRAQEVGGGDEGHEPLAEEALPGREAGRGAERVQQPAEVERAVRQLRLLHQRRRARHARLVAARASGRGTVAARMTRCTQTRVGS